MIDVDNEILLVTAASEIIHSESVQALWGGYGEIKRYVLADFAEGSIILKHVQWPEKTDSHPRGWNTSLSHQRKVKSYQVEKNWYSDYASLTEIGCRVPQCYHASGGQEGLLLIMEDLDAAGYPIRLTPSNVTLLDAKNCLSWLAKFHAKFMKKNPEGLWPIGTYWHLDTRPDELKKMQNLALKQVAGAINDRLNAAHYQTLVHGDAKLANFCFGNDNQVAVVDFQYVGGGCGMKDVAYFISSCFDEYACEKHEATLLTHYFNQLESSIDKSIDFQSLKEEWMALYPFAWADFYRFLDGWSPGHWKMHPYSESITEKVIKSFTS